jgi:hypothetical protein
MVPVAAIRQKVLLPPGHDYSNGAEADVREP